jgi:phospholipase/carboxylesterase
MQVSTASQGEITVPSDPADVMELLPAQGAPRLLFILLHGYGARADDLLPLAEALRYEFPAAACVLPQGFEPTDPPFGRQWFSLREINERNRPERVAAALPALADFVRAQQQRYGIVNPDTALVGFSQGAIMALELATQYDGLVGRVLAFSGRYARLPSTAPELTSIHLFHGEDDEVVPAAHTRAAYERLAELQGDVTVDLASAVGHELHPALVARAISRLQTCVPLRTWRRALGMQGS